MPLQVVATDGGLITKGVAVQSMRHGGAERYEVVIDFSKAPSSTKRIELLNGSNKNNINYEFTGKVMAFDLLDGPVSKTRANFETGAQEPDPTWNRDYHQFKLVDSEVMSLPTAGPYVRRHLWVERVGGEWMLGNMTWKQVEGGDFTKVLASPAIGDVEIWEISNHAEGWNHPVHIHLTDFRIFKRVGGAGRVFPFEEGPKDVMYLGEGETVHVLVKFTEPGGDPQVKGGRYMVHCHNFVHEDHDMMGQFSVGSVDFGTDPHHPIRAAPPRPDLTA